jgi:hypothetical protein
MSEALDRAAAWEADRAAAWEARKVLLRRGVGATRLLVAADGPTNPIGSATLPSRDATPPPKLTLEPRQPRGRPD